MFTMEFTSGRGPIEVAVDCNGNGKAYIRRDDMIAEIRDGVFAHPALGIEYRVMMPVPARNGGEAVLATRVWWTVGTATVFDNTSGT